MPTKTDESRVQFLRSLDAQRRLSPDPSRRGEAGRIRSFGCRGTCEIYDPVANTFRAASDLTVPRFAHTTMLLSNGKLLITGGFNPIIASAEIYDVAGNTAAQPAACP
jgi:hypothetical protein